MLLSLPVLAEAQPAAAPKPETVVVHRVGESRVNPKDGLTYVWIPPGTFRMGCSPGDNECSTTRSRPTR